MLLIGKPSISMDHLLLFGGLEHLFSLGKTHGFLWKWLIGGSDYIKVPSGYQVSLFDADYRGYVAPNTTGRLRAEYFFAGERGPIFRRSLRGEQEYNVQDKLMASSWSRCGDSLNMRINSSMTATGRGMASVDSLDLARRGGFIYHIKYRACDKL